MEDIDATCVKALCKEFTSLNRKGHILTFKLENNTSNVPEIFHCIDVSTNLRVKLYLKKVPVPLLEWFRQGRNVFLTSKAVMVYFIPHLGERSEEQNKILYEVNRFKQCIYTM